MDRSESGRHRFGCGMRLLLACALTLAAGSRPARADAPYDPDWPEVFLILAHKCSGCHRPGTERTDFSSYERLLDAGHDDGMPVVVPGQPRESTLWQYVSWNVRARKDSPFPDQPEMPHDRREWLTAGQLETVERWIRNGARQHSVPCPTPTSHPTPLDFPSARECKVCHPRHYSEWSRSMHAYAQHSPVFEAFTLTMVERTGGTIGTFCTRCHTPLGVALGENESMRNVHRNRLSMEGVSCIVCHRRKDGRYKSNGRVAVEPGGVLDTCVFGPFDDSVAEEIQGHSSAGQPYLKSSQFCGECHDVTSPNGVRLEEAFSEWQNSPAAKHGVTCQNCHMGPRPGIPMAEDERPLGRAAEIPGVDPSRIPVRRLSDHTFAGPDYSLLPDTEFPRKLDWMYETDYRDESRLTPHQQRTLRELRIENREQLRIAADKRIELLQNSACLSVQVPDRVTAGQRFHVRVDVRSLFAGHALPTGFTAERQVWVSVEVVDQFGQIMRVSGDVDHNGDLRDEHSHDVLSGKMPYDRQLLNFQSKFIALTNKGTERSVILTVNRDLSPLSVLRPAPGIAASFGRPAALRLAKGSLPPLATAGRRYPVVAPDCGGSCQVIVRLNFRHLPPTLLDHIGIPHLKHLLETVVIDEFVATIVVDP